MFRSFVLVFTLLLYLSGSPLAKAQSVVSSSGEKQGDEMAKYKLLAAEISPDFPFKSHYVQLSAGRIHYIDEGQGKPLVFIHGNPSSSFLWRNIVPYVSSSHRVIALDLMGMGRSDKPENDYRFFDHFEFLQQFLTALDLQEITFVVHDWGAALGFEYARRYPEEVEAIAFMEGVLPPIFPQPSFDNLGPELGPLFQLLKDPARGHEFIIEQNGFVEQLLPNFVNRSLSEAEMAVYRAPFTSSTSRKPILIWPQEIPIAGLPQDIVLMMQDIEEFMASTNKPMLLLYASPGAVLPPDAVPWFEETIDQLETAYIGQGLHFIQEDQPQAIGRALADWLRRLNKD